MSTHISCDSRTGHLHKISGPEKENENYSCAVRGRPATPNIAKSPSLYQRRESNHRWWPNLSVYYQNLSVSYTKLFAI